MNIDFSLLTIEIMMALLGMGMLVVGLLTPHNQRKGLGYLSACALIIILLLSFGFRGMNTSTINGMFVVDDFGLFFKQLAIIAAIFVSLMSTRFIDKLEQFKGEFFSLIVFAALGMIIMVGAVDLLTMYLGLEMMTITFYILSGYMRKDSLSIEAGLKYVLLGAMSSAIMMYGISLCYGLSGSTKIDAIAAAISQGVSPAILLALAMLVGGFAFKISAVPFHMWSPDVYQGAPSPVTAFLAVGSKASAFAVFARILFVGFPDLQPVWVSLLAGLAALSMIIGNIVAIPQTNLKRMLAYSGAAQAGYIMTGLIAGTSDGLRGFEFYLMIYVFATMGAFGVATAFGNATGSTEIKDLAGLAQRNPLMASALAVSLLSMAGIPPLAGFSGKLLLFYAVVDQGYLWLAILGLVMSMVSVFYYLSVAKSMYAKENEDMSAIEIDGTSKFVLIAAMVLTIAMGIWPAPLTQMATAASKFFF